MAENKLNPGNFYDIFENLNAQNLATQEAQDNLRKQFLGLAKKVHRDKGGSDEEFKRLNEAYDTLKEKEKRERYDEMLKTKVTEAISPPEAGPMPVPDNNRPGSLPQGPVYYAKVDMSVIEKAYNDFADNYMKEKGLEGSREANGFSMQKVDHANGSYYLLSFPNQQSRNDCIQQMLNQNLIESRQLSLQEEASKDKKEDQTKELEQEQKPEPEPEPEQEQEQEQDPWKDLQDAMENSREQNEAQQRLVLKKGGTSWKDRAQAEGAWESLQKETKADSSKQDESQKEKRSSLSQLPKPTPPGGDAGGSS